MYDLKIEIKKTPGVTIIKDGDKSVSAIVSIGGDVLTIEFPSAAAAKNFFAMGMAAAMSYEASVAAQQAKDNAAVNG